MKKLILLLLFIPLVSCDDSKKADKEEKTETVEKAEILVKNKRKSLRELKLKGKVKSVVSSYYKVEGDLLVEKGEFDGSFKQEFNEDGNIIEETSYNSEGQSTNHSKFKYDEDGNQIEQAQYNEEGKLTAKWKYKYDDDGNLVEETVVYENEGEFTTKWKYKYDDDGNRIERNGYDVKDGELFDKEKLKYDEDGNKFEKTNYNEEGELYSKWEYIYDEYGNMVEEMWFDGYNFYLNNIYEYVEKDNNGNWTKSLKSTGTFGFAYPSKIEEREIEYY